MPFEKRTDGQTGAGGRTGSWQGLVVRRGRKRNRGPWTVAGLKPNGMIMPSGPLLCKPVLDVFNRGEGRGEVESISLAHLLWEWRISIPPTGEFHASAKFFVLMLPHFFSSLFNYTRHSHSFMFSSSGSWKRFPGPGLSDGLETRDRNRYAEVTQRPKGCQETARVGSGLSLNFPSVGNDGFASAGFASCNPTQRIDRCAGCWSGYALRQVQD